MIHGENVVATPLSVNDFVREGEALANHSFLVTAAEGKLPKSVWAAYVGNRLGAGEHFVGFLRALLDATKGDEFKGIHAAVLSNLREELGIERGAIKTEKAHATWRTQFRSAMERILPQETFQVPVGGTNSYAELLEGLEKKGDVIEMTGALAGLEILIAEEYGKILEGIRTQFGDLLNAKDLLYIASHAEHDWRHFDEIFKPLQLMCNTREKALRAIGGLGAAAQSKIDLLDGMMKFHDQKK